MSNVRPRPRAFIRATCLSAVMVATFPGFASAGMKHRATVSSDPVDYTPWLVATEGVPRPHVDAIGQIGSTIFVGGLFDKAGQPGGTPEYNLSIEHAIKAFQRPSPGECPSCNVRPILHFFPSRTGGKPVLTLNHEPARLHHLP